MTDITDLILKKYYGFGADPNTEKFLSSYEAAYLRSRFDEKSDTPEPVETETIAETADQGPSVDAAQNEVINSIEGDSIGNDIVRSSRAILDNDVLQEEEGSDTSVYDALLASNASNAKRSSTPKIEKIDEPKEFIKNDSIQLEHCEDVFSEKASDESSISKKKKKPRKKSALTNVSTVSSLPPQPPKKLPACNGVFLDLTNLSLTEFPINMLTNMPNLRMLYLENNSLTALPKQLFSSLRLLQWLDVRNNKLTTLPKTMKNHPCLETILLDGNLFEELPLELCLLPNLRELHTLRNPLTFPPNDILALGFTATINVLRAKWNKLNPNEIIESPDRDRKAKPSTILCSDPPILRTISKTSRISGSSSGVRVTNGISRQISVREKSRNYRPSNRYETFLRIKTKRTDYVDDEEIIQEEAVLCDSCAKKTSKVSSSTEIQKSMHDDLDEIVQSPKFKLPKIDAKKCIFTRNFRKDARERIFDIITNDRTMEKLCPMRLKDPDIMLAFLENYLGIKKRSSCWFPTHQRRT